MRKSTHYSLPKRMICLALSVVLLLGLTGCPASQTKPSVPEPIIKLQERLKEEEAAYGTTKANLYYDNTRSMYGYVCAGSGSSDFSAVLEQTIGLIGNYDDHTVNALMPDENNYLQWVSVSDEDLKNGFRTHDFYTNVGFFNENAGDYGPLQTLFKDDSTVNFDELNIFITDLAEQKLNNFELAKKINDIVQARDDHSVALYRISSNFSGYAAVPIPKDTNGNGKMRMLENEDFQSKRSFYCVLVGPTIEINGFCKDVDNSLSELELENGVDYDCLTILSHRGVKYSPISRAEAIEFNDLYIQGDRDNIYQSVYGITKDCSNVNYNVELLEDSDLVFGHEGVSLPGLYYKYNVENGIDSTDTDNYAIINFALPLSNLSNGKLANLNEFEYTINENSINAKGAYLNENNEYVWKDIPTDKLLGGSSPYMESPVLRVYNKGKEIYITNDRDIQKTITEEGHSSKDAKIYTVQNESGALLITLSFEKIKALREKYDYIVIDFDINGLRKVSEKNKPGWIEKYSLPISSVPDNYKKPDGNPEFFTKTIGLDKFYNYLVGNDIPAVAKKDYEGAMTTVISDVVITVDVRN